MKEKLERAYKNLEIAANSYRCNAEERVALNEDLAIFKQLIDEYQPSIVVDTDDKRTVIKTTAEPELN